MKKKAAIRGFFLRGSYSAFGPLSATPFATTISVRVSR